MNKIAILILTGLFSLTVFAGSNGSTEMGPLVDCHLSDTKVDYIPKMMCKSLGGKEM